MRRIVGNMRRMVGVVAEPEGAERRKRQDGGVWSAVPGVVRGVHAAEVAYSGAEVPLGVGVEDLCPATTGRQSDAVSVVRDCGEVRDAGEQRLITIAAHEAEHIVRRVVRVDPAEASTVLVESPERRRLRVRRVQVAYE